MYAKSLFARFAVACLRSENFEKKLKIARMKNFSASWILFFLSIKVWYSQHAIYFVLFHFIAHCKLRVRIWWNEILSRFRSYLTERLRKHKFWVKLFFSFHWSLRGNEGNDFNFYSEYRSSFTVSKSSQKWKNYWRPRSVAQPVSMASWHRRLYRWKWCQQSSLWWSADFRTNCHHCRWNSHEIFK